MPVKPEHVIQRNGKDYVLYAGLLNAAHEAGIKGISTTLVQVGSSVNGNWTIVHATVEMKDGTYMGIGDVGPSDPNPVAKGAPIRMAETRAKARALRDALNIGYLLEGEDDEPVVPPSSGRAGGASPGASGTSNGNSTSSTHATPTRASDEEYKAAVEKGARLLHAIIKIRDEGNVLTPTPDDAIWTDLPRLRALYTALARDNRERGLVVPV